MHILNGFWIQCCDSKQSRNSSTFNSNTFFKHSTKHKYSLRRSSVLQPSNSHLSSYDISRRFTQGQFLILFVVCYQKQMCMLLMLSMASLSLTRQSDHTGLAYSNKGPYKKSIKVHLTPKYFFFRLNKSLHLFETHCALLD